MRVWCGLSVVAMVGVLAGGCASGQTESAPQSKAPEPSTEQKSARPSDLPVSGMSGDQLCGVLTPAQQGELGLGRSSPGNVGETEYPGCVWNESATADGPGVGIGVAVAPQSVQEFLDQQVSAPAPETRASYMVAGGFPAEQAQRGGGFEQFGCSVFVDVAEGQTLWVLATTLVPGEKSNQEMCGKAKQAAELTVTTLESQG